jgi:hypothetical protein
VDITNLPMLYATDIANSFVYVEYLVLSWTILVKRSVQGGSYLLKAAVFPREQHTCSFSDQRVLVSRAAARFRLKVGRMLLYSVPDPFDRTV